MSMSEQGGATTSSTRTPRLFERSDGLTGQGTARIHGGSDAIMYYACLQWRYGLARRTTEAWPGSWQDETRLILMIGCMKRVLVK